MTEALDFFCEHAGDDGFKEMYREVFLGGEERIKTITDWLATNKKEHGLCRCASRPEKPSAVVWNRCSESFFLGDPGGFV